MFTWQVDWEGEAEALSKVTKTYRWSFRKENSDIFEQTVSFCIRAPTNFGGRGRLFMDFSSDLSCVIIIRVSFVRSYQGPSLLPKAALTETDEG